MSWQRSSVMILIVALGVGVGASAMAGSPWVLKEGDSVLQFDFRAERADREYLPDGTNQKFPLEGRYASQSLFFSLRHGLGNDLEASVAMAYKSVSYTSDPVSIFASEGGPQIIPTFSFSDHIEGLADVHTSVRYNAYKGAVLVTPELKLKIPTGYQPPSGTFENNDPGLKTDEGGNPLENTEGDVPIEDDVTLGDGQVDVTASVLFGAFASATKSFARAGVGFNYRFGDPGHQIVYDAKLGQLIGKRVVAFVGIQGAKTITEGEIIGTSFATKSPSADASKFLLEDFVFIEDLRVDRDFLEASFGALIRAGAYEVILSGSKVLDGSNTAEIVSTSLATSYKF